MENIEVSQNVESRKVDRKIGPLDGVRAVAILAVVWFHFWQQSWLMPVNDYVNLDWLPRNGAIAVDLMILLSGFCLFLPYARNMVYGDKVASPIEFYKKRMIRIMPSYYVALLIVLLCFAIPGGAYGSTGAMLQDLLPHLVFVHNWFGASAQATQLNGVLWTVGVLAQFYVLFPFLAVAFRKKPVTTYCGMTAVGLLASYLISINFGDINTGLYVNNTFTFMSVYANGMMAAYGYVYITKNREQSRMEGVFFSIVSIACIWVYKILCDHRQQYYGGEQLWQVDYRYLLSLVFMIFVVSTALSTGIYRKIWDNVVMRFLATISFNLYICHQYIAVKLKEYHFPEWSGADNGWTTDAAWKWKYTLLCLVISLVVATAMTFLVEKPVAKLLTRKKNK